ncbi:hypothetical protein HWC35_gp186 [Vibrio phage USC-1]|uniref:Uncharacterized protein n=2 Tax=Aphroditevirus USC1 TaxID=2846605 RepID=A0A514A2S4_9CAUD|nr:hypothetical protein HWC35_gp186 [Vibrio phage USC-1]QCW23147.1 hypothetical protein [Vibrio phage 5 TSL-2019]QDH47580.1 hypothetical protein [Vibrio phage USC-1]
MYASYPQKLAIVSAMASVRGEVMIIKGIENSARTVWDGFRDRASGSHLIEKVAFSNLKTESLKSFSAAVLKLCLDAKGKTLNGYSDDIIVEKDDRFTSTISRMAAVTNLTFDRAFATILSTVIGYDQLLVESIIQKEETPEAIARLTFEYGVRKFGLADMDYAGVMLLDNLDEDLVTQMNDHRDLFWAEVTNVIGAKQYMDLFELVTDISSVRINLPETLQ